MKSLLWHFEHGTTPKSSGSNQPEAANRVPMGSYAAVAVIQLWPPNAYYRPGADFRSGGTATRFRRRADISTGVVTVQSTWSGNFAGQPYVSASSSKRLRRISCLKSSANAVTKSGDVNSVVLSFFTTKNLLSLNHSISG